MDSTVVAALVGLVGVVFAVIVSAITVLYQVRRSGELTVSLEKRQQSQIEKVAQVKPEDIQEVAASQLAIISNFNESVLRQAQQSFTFALVAAIIGLSFFIAAIGFLIVTRSQDISNASLISGALVEAISGVNFYLYGRAANQFSIFHKRLDRVQHFLLANSICESLTGDRKEETRAEIIRMIVNFAINSDNGIEKVK